MSQAVRVGIFATICLVALGWLILRIEDLHLFGAKGRRVDAVFESVAGLDDKSAVRVAGVRVGRVDGINLEGQKARVTLLLERPVKLTEGTHAAIANMGLLGDKYVELQLGPEGGVELPPGATLPGITPISFDQAMAKVEAIGDSIKKVTDSLTGATGEGGFGDLIASITKTSDELRALIEENRGQLGATIGNFEKFSATLSDQLPRLADQLERVLSQVEGVVAENRGDLKDSMANIKELTTRLQASADNLNAITGKIARGEGTIGKLVNDDKAHDELVSTLESVKSGVGSLQETLGRMKKVSLGLSIESGYLTEPKDSRTEFHLDLLPNGAESEHFYRFGLVNDPRGRSFEKRETVTVTFPDGHSETTVTDKQTADKTRDSYTALVGFPASHGLSLWAGLIESTGGVSAEYRLTKAPIWFSLEAFAFSRPNDLDPHLRLAGRWQFHRNLYLVGGYDDPLVKDFKSFYVGAGLRWTDDDLKYLLGSLPVK
jgi:phospholipid/cholesterol/gamma-HCH transport system substrate-binding protein